jgi:hypothetical protein
MEGCKLLLLTYSFFHYFPAIFMKSICVSVAPGGYDFIEPSVYELDGAIVLNRNAYPSGFANHVSEVLSPRDTPRHAVVMRAMDALEKSQSSHIYVLSFSRVVKRH